MDKISNNSIAFIALCNEFCEAIEKAKDYSRTDFIKLMLRLLPRLYITATDLDIQIQEDAYVDDSLNEEKYNATKEVLANLFGEDDTYLEVFEQDMKYSDTPIAVTISEGLSDIFQVLYNFIETVKDSPLEIIHLALSAIKEDFGQYWSQRLCNIQRPLNNLRYLNVPEYEN